MALPLPSSSFLFKNSNSTTVPRSFRPLLQQLPPYSLSFTLLPSSSPPIKLSSSTTCFSSTYSFSGDLPDKPPTPTDEESEGSPTTPTDEWGEKAEPEIEPVTKLSDSDPPKDEDEWGGGSTEEEYVVSGNGSAPAAAAAAVEDLGNGKDGDQDKLSELKRCLVDTVYGTDLGFRASSEVRAEVLELVTQLEGLNPTPVPTDAVEVLDGNWVLLYTAFSELLPLLAAGTTPLLKVEKICQAINTSSLTIDNSITLSGPFASFSFSASATFEVRSPSRVQVQFKEGSFKPPEIKSSINLPENLEVFGQNINLSPVQQSLNPLQETVAGLARAISGQQPLKIPIPGERTQSWLLITYLDQDLRISRGDGGLFVLAKEGSPLLDQ